MQKQAKTSVPKQRNFSAAIIYRDSLISDSLLEESQTEDVVPTQCRVREFSFSFTFSRTPAFMSPTLYKSLFPGTADQTWCLLFQLQRADLTEATVIDANRNREGRREISTRRRGVLGQTVACQQREKYQNWTRDGRWGDDVRWLTLTRWVYTSKSKSILFKIVQILSSVIRNVLESITRGLKN